MKEIKKIDVHTHVTAYPEYIPRWKNGFRFLSAEEQLQVLDDMNVEMAVILPIIAPEKQWGTMSNEEAKATTVKYPDRFIWFCNVDPRQAEYCPEADLEFILRQYKALGAKGVGEITTTLYADDPMMDNLFRACASLEMPVLIHIAPILGRTYGIIDDPGLPRIERMLKKHPDLKLIGHSACFWNEISQNDLTGLERNGYPKGKVKEGELAQLMRNNPNLYADLSAGSGANAMMRDPEYAVKFLNEFADRILYGTDLCNTEKNFHYEFNAFLDGLVESGSLSVDNYKKIVRENAIKLLNL